MDAIIKVGTRVKSKVHACYEGKITLICGKIYVVEWDVGGCSYLHEEDFTVLENQNAPFRE